MSHSIPTVSDPTRRRVLAGAALAVPAITLAAASPALAASGTRTVGLSSPSPRALAAGATPVTASVTSDGAPQAGQAVSFTGPAGTVFSPATGVTDGSGTTVTSMDPQTPWARPGSTVTVTAASGAQSASLGLQLLGANLVSAGTEFATTFAQGELAFPSPVVQAATASAIASGRLSHVVLLADGTVWTRGSNNWGQLGDGTTTARSTWAQVAGLTGVTQVAVATSVSYALLSDGTIRSWGWNVNGQLGDGTRTAHSRPAPVVGLPAPAVQLRTGTRTGYAVLNDGRLYAWGSADSYRIIHTGLTRPASDLNGPDALTAVQMEGFGDIADVAVWNSGGMVVSTSGVLSTWGPNDSGQLGDGSTGCRAQPGAVSLPARVVRACASGGNRFALLDDGTVFSWGFGGDGLGDGSTASRSTPTRIPGLVDVTDIGTSNTTSLIARLRDGSVRGWGANTSGYLGTGSTTAVATPTVLPLPASAPGVRAIGTGMGSGATHLILDV